MAWGTGIYTTGKLAKQKSFDELLQQHVAMESGTSEAGRQREKWRHQKQKAEELGRIFTR
jgi:hypothetical protein